MTRLFVDTNVILDLLAAREPFVEEAQILFSMSARQEVELITSALSIANTAYILNRQLDGKTTRTLIRKFRSWFRSRPWINPSLIKPSRMMPSPTWKTHSNTTWP